ncbi:tetratricopeptide repeat protein [bacterium]|nr:tetratricopeptide repeat protein [bacterium]
MSRLNLIPRFVAEQDRQENRKGEFAAAALFFDIVDFTSITRSLRVKGRIGAEELSLLLDIVYTPILNTIYNHNGFITGFAGDSLLAVFPLNDSSEQAVCGTALDTALAIRDKLKRRKNRFRSLTGENEILAKIGLSFGTVSWGILGNDSDMSYYFAGESIIGCAALNKICEPGDIVLDDSFISASQGVNGNFTLKNETRIPKKKLLRLNKRIVTPFISSDTLRSDLRGEFRDVVSVFVALRQQASFDYLNKVASSLLPICREYGGFFNGFTIDDKGPHLSCFFGAPRAYENNVERALDFSNEILSKFNDDIRVGISYNTVFTGFVGSVTRCEYTALGDAVNLAARLMQRAKWGNILIAGNVARYLPGDYTITETYKEELKGIAQPVEVYSIESNARTSEHRFFEGKMFGREEELKRAKAFTAPVNKGINPGVLYIYGDPGIGKSRLFYELSQSVKDQVTVFELQADEILRRSKNPFIAFFKSYFDYSEDDSAEVNATAFNTRWDSMLGTINEVNATDSASLIAELERTKSLLGALIGIYWNDSLYELLNPSGRFENTITAITSFFIGQSLVKPLVIAQDDLQWLDEDSKTVYQALIKAAARYPISLILLSRYLDDGGKPSLAIPPKTNTDEIELKALLAGVGGELVSDKLDKPGDEELLRFVNERASGNPFYLEQLVLYLKESGLLQLTDNCYSLVKNAAAVPDSLRPMLIARIDRLSSSLKEVVQVAAVLGREFEANILTGVIAVISKKLPRSEVDLLLGKGEATALWSLVGELLYIFKHVLLREAAYEMQLFRRLRILHGLAGKTLETLHGNDRNRYADIAFHYHKAEEGDKAQEYLIKAADFAKDEYMNEESLSLYGTALEYIAEPEEKYAVLVKMADVLHRVGKWDEERVNFDQCLEIAVELNNDSLRAKTLDKIGWLLSFVGKEEEALKYLNESLELSNKTEDSVSLISTFRNIGHVYTNKGEYDRAEEYLIKSLTIAEENKEVQSELAPSMTSLGSLYSLFSKYDKAIKWYKKAYDVVKNTDRLEDKSSVLGNLGIVYMNMGHHREAFEYYEKSLAISEKLGIKRKIAVICGNMGQLYRMQGDFRKAIELIERQIGIAIEIGDVLQEAVALYNLADTYRHAEDFEAGMPFIVEGIRLSKELKNDLFLAVYQVIHAEYKFGVGDYEKAERLVNEGLRMAEKVKFPDAIYDAEVLSARLTARRDKQEGVAALKLLLDKYQVPKKAAMLTYYLFEVTGTDEYRKLAEERLSSLYEKTPDYMYKYALDKLR